MEYTYYPKGVCSNKIDIEVEGNIIKNVKFYGGCNGNLKALSKLVKGMTIESVSEILSGNTCGFRPTSCADQLVQGLNEAMALDQEAASCEKAEICAANEVSDEDKDLGQTEKENEEAEA